MSARLHGAPDTKGLHLLPESAVKLTIRIASDRFGRLQKSPRRCSKSSSRAGMARFLTYKQPTTRRRSPNIPTPDAALTAPGNAHSVCVPKVPSDREVAPNK